MELEREAVFTYTGKNGGVYVKKGYVFKGEYLTEEEDNILQECKN